jgi:hypothetical protein
MMSTIERAVDVQWLNHVANDPAVLPNVIGLMDPPLDLSPVIADSRNVCLIGEHGAIVFHHQMPGLYDAHPMFLEAGRGKWGTAFATAARHWLFTRTDAVEIIARCPRGNLAAKVLAKSLGFTYEMTNHRGWALGGEVVPADVYTLLIQHWMRDAPGLVERGRWFHEKLDSEHERLGASVQPSEPDLARDRYVGAAWEMILGGQTGKGLVFNSRWAAFSQDEPAELVMQEPLAIRAAGSVLIVRDGDFYAASLADAA